MARDRTISRSTSTAAPMYCYVLETVFICGIKVLYQFSFDLIMEKEHCHKHLVLMAQYDCILAACTTPTAESATRGHWWRWTCEALRVTLFNGIR